MELEGDVLERVRAYESRITVPMGEVATRARLALAGLVEWGDMALITVKKSTLATWCRDIALTEAQIEAIEARRAPKPGIPRDTQRKRRRQVEPMRAQALLEAEHPVDDPFWVTGGHVVLGRGFEDQTASRIGQCRSPSSPHVQDLVSDLPSC